MSLFLENLQSLLISCGLQSPRLSVMPKAFHILGHIRSKGLLHLNQIPHPLKRHEFSSATNWQLTKVRPVLPVFPRLLRSEPSVGGGRSSGRGSAPQAP